MPTVLYQGGDTPQYRIQLSSSTVSQILTENFLSWHYVAFTIVDFNAEN